MNLLKEGKEPVLESCAIVGRRLDKDQVADIHHQSGHLDAKWTLYFARLVNPQVYLTESGKAHFGGLNRYAAISIDKPVFSVTYDCSNKEWTASWKWANGCSPSKLSNSVQEYVVPCHARDAYENEILQWQRNGWLLPYSEELGPPKGLIPLMAVVQKQKVRPVLDYRELNGFVNAFTANAEVCVQKLREWQQQGVNVSLLDLQSAYLQIHVDKAV